MPMQIAQASDGFAATASGAAAHGPKRRLFQSKKVSRDQVLGLTRELATLLRAGLPLDRALEILISLAPTPPVAALMQGIRDNVRGGKSLSQALDARREVFSRFYVNIVRAGEAGGALGLVLQRLAETMERNKELRENVRSALIYPTILICVAVVSVIILLIFVVPQFQQTFSQAGKALPLPTQIVIVIGTFMRRWWWAVIALVFLGVLWFRRRGANPVIRRARDARLLRAPLLGDVLAKVEVARFARTLATLIGNGVTLSAVFTQEQAEVFSTAADGQTQIVVAPFRGTNQMAADNHSLGKFQLVGIPPAARGAPKIEVTFTITERQVLLSARDVTHNKELKVQRLNGDAKQ